MMPAHNSRLGFANADLGRVQLSEVEYRQVMSHHPIGPGDTMTRLDRSSLAKSVLQMYRPVLSLIHI